MTVGASTDSSKIQKRWRDAVEAVAAEVGGTVRKDYSGRGMYGATCYGIVTDDSVNCIEIAAEHGLKRAEADSMGRQAIVYWPHIKGASE